MSNSTDKKNTMTIVHSIIGVAIMLFFRYLPISLPEITPIGIQVVGIFIGTLYLWTFIDPLWGSLMSIAMLGFSDYMPMSGIIKEAFGSPVTQQVFFLMIMSGALVYYKITLYIGRFFLTRKVTNGKPWLLVFVVCLGSYLIAGFINCFTAIFLFWPILYDIFEEVGYKKGDAFPRVMLTLVVVSALIGFPMAPYMQNGLALLTNFATITANIPGGPVVVNNAAYMAVAIILGMVMLVANVLFSKFVIRPDVSKLKNYDVETLNKHPLPPMDAQQKVITGGFVVLILCLMIPSLLPSLPGMAFLTENSYGLCIFVVALLAAIQINGKSALEIPKVVPTNVNWGAYFIIMAAILLGNVLTNDSTGVSAFLSVVLSPIFQGMSSTVFIILLLFMACVLTNVCNSLVIGMILQPVVVTYCVQSGANPAPIVTLLILFVLLSAAITPAASPFAAILHSNKEWVPTKYVYQYTVPYVLIEFVLVLIVGIPLANILM